MSQTRKAARAGSLLVALGVWLALASFAAPRVSIAEAQGAGSTDYLIRLLHDSDAFRVRARACDALGSRASDPGVIEALVAALRDSNGAVRAACVASLGRVGDASVLGALRALTGDSEREREVRSAARAAITAIESRTSGGGGGGGSTGGGGASGPARYYVGIGLPGTTAGVSDAIRRSAREALRSAAAGVAGVVIAPDGESAADATRALRSRSLTGFFLDSTITTVEDTPAGVRVVVQIVVQDYPGRNVRAMLSGRATITGEHNTSSPGVADAIAAAFAGAMRQLPAAMAGSRGGGSR